MFLTLLLSAAFENISIVLVFVAYIIAESSNDRLCTLNLLLLSLFNYSRSSSSTSTSSSSPGGDIVHFAPSGSVTLCPALPWQHAYPGELLQLYGFGSLTPPYSRRQTCALDALPLSFFDKAPVAMQSAPLDVSSKKLLIYKIYSTSSTIQKDDMHH